MAQQAIITEFSDYIEDSVKQLNIKRNIYVENYLVMLLSNFSRKKEDFLSDQPLIFRLSNSKKLEDFVSLGDETLFITGFFPETFLKDKNKNYVIGIGKDSYMCAAKILNYEGEGHIYNVLSRKFKSYSNVLNDVKYNMLEKIDDKEFFQIYKIWKSYNNKKALKKLKEAGLIVE